MAETARKGPQFPWDHSIPQTPFWTNIPYPCARNIHQCLPASTLSPLNLTDPPLDQKWDFLRDLLNRTLAAREEASQPQSLHDADYKTWSNLMIARSSVEYYSGNLLADEEIVYEMLDNGMNDAESGKPTRNLSALHRIAGIKEAKGEYSEAENIEREIILPWFEGHETLGRDAPQTIGCVRMIAKCVWKQGRYEEGERWLEEVRDRIEVMKKGKFEKYVGDEVRMVEELREELNAWRSEKEE